MGFLPPTGMLIRPLRHEFLEEAHLLRIEGAILDALALVLRPIEERTALHPVLIRQMVMLGDVRLQRLVVSEPVFRVLHICIAQ